MIEKSTYNYSYTNDDKSEAVIHLNNNVLGGGEALEFGNLLADILACNPKSISINLSKVEVMNSSGLGMLVSALTSTKKAGIDLVLLEVPEKVKSLLELTHLNTIFTISN